MDGKRKKDIEAKADRLVRSRAAKLANRKYTWVKLLMLVVLAGVALYVAFLLGLTVGGG